MSRQASALIAVNLYEAFDADIRIAIPHQPLTNVCFTPNSGRSTGCRGMSAYDP